MNDEELKNKIMNINKLENIIKSRKVYCKIEIDENLKQTIDVMKAEYKKNYMKDYMNEYFNNNEDKKEDNKKKTLERYYKKKKIIE